MIPLDHRRFRLFTTSLLALMMVVYAVSAGADEATQLKKSTQELNQLRSNIQSLDKELKRDRSHRDQLQEKIEASEKQLAELETSLRQQRKATATQTEQLRKTQAQRVELEQQLTADKVRLGKQIRAAYISGSSGSAKLVLQQTNPAQLTRLLTYFDYLNRARSQVIASTTQKREQIQALEQSQQAQVKKLAAAQAKQARTLDQLNGKRADRLAAVSKLKAKIGSGEDRLQDLRAGEQEIRTLISRLRTLLEAKPEKTYRSAQPIRKRYGKMPWPLRGKLLATFGAPKADGKLKWNGLWIAANEGTPVHVVADGRIAYVGRMQRYGLIAVVEHGDGYFSLYGHNGSVDKQEGDTVKAGEVLAHAGASGGHDESGLYFELRKGSQPVDPLDWLTK